MRGGGNPKPRIEYIDLMKGICILMVVAVHCGIMPNTPFSYMLKAFRIPLYFFLSGLFFKEYNGFLDFTIRKVNKLIVPYIFFSLSFLIVWAFMHGEQILSIKELFITAIVGNYPLWFLRCLFLTNIIFYILHKYIHRRLLLLTCFIIGLVALGIDRLSWPIASESKYSTLLFCINNILYLIQSFIVLPFFAFGFLIKPHIIQTLTLKLSIALFSISFILLYLTGQYPIDIYYHIFGHNPIFFYIAGISGTICTILLCQRIKHIPGISYLGRYSIIILGTHRILIFIFSLYLHSKLAIWGITVLSMFIIIPICLKFFPYFTAQKDIFRLKSQMK